MKKPKLIRITTVPISLDKLLEGQLNYMNDKYEVVAVSSGGPLLEEVGQREEVRTKAIEMTREITPLKDLRALRQMIAFLKKEKPDIVHTHTPKAGIVGMLAAKICKVPHRFHTVAGMPLLEATGQKLKILKRVEKFTYNCATKVLPNSQGLKEIILKEKLARETHLHVIAQGSSNGIDVNHFDPKHFLEENKANLRSDWGIEEKDFVFIFVGRLVGDKGINELVEAFEAMEVKYPEAKLLLVGNKEPDLDPLRPEIDEKIEKNQKIIPTGFQKDVRPFFAISKALAFPSYREGFPNVVMQAGAMGLPAVVSDINGCNEIIENGKNGLIVPVKNRTKLEKAMRQLMDRKVYGHLQKNARELIVNRYQRKRVWEGLKAFYENQP